MTDKCALAPRLNEDILAEVIPYLSARDALAYSATCSFLRHLAIQHAVRDVSFSEVANLIKFSEFMLDESSPRLHLLRRLTINFTILPPTYAASFIPLARLIAAAPKLEHLALCCVELFVSTEPLLGDAIASHTQLTSLEFSTFGSTTQATLLGLRCAPILRHLVLHDADSLPLHPDTRSVYLPLLPSLETLSLDGVKALPSRATLPSLAPSLRSLHLRNVKFRDADPSSGTWWKESLVHLRGDIPSLVSLRLPCIVTSLEVDAVLDNEHAWDPAPLFDVLQRASPVSLSITMHACLKQPFWQTYAPAMPRLCCVKLFIEHVNRDEAGENWLQNISKPGPTSVRAICVCLRASAHAQDQLGPSLRSKASLTNRPGLHMRLLRAATRSLPSLCLFGFAAGSRAPSEDNNALIQNDIVIWWMGDPHMHDKRIRGVEQAWRQVTEEEARRTMDELERSAAQS
ncbi:hypothetical protein BD414DRAFT_61518 [Trametes punicea]|nr:hypothetical protein BD414DRAFT_61518 [Trametes punicea]